MKNRAAFTIMEILLAITMASFMAAIGFTGISAFGKSITRSKQFTSESEVILACMRMAVADAEKGNPAMTASSLETPKNWVQCAIAGDRVTLTLDSGLVLTSAGGGGTSNIRGGLNMGASNNNTITIKTVVSKL